MTPRAHNLPLAAAITGAALNLLLLAVTVLVDFGTLIFVPGLLAALAAPVLGGLIGAASGAILLARGQRSRRLAAGTALSLLLLLAAAAEIGGMLYLNQNAGSFLLFMIA